MVWGTAAPLVGCLPAARQKAQCSAVSSRSGVALTSCLPVFLGYNHLRHNRAIAPLSIVTADVRPFMMTRSSYNRKGEIEHKHPKTKQASNLEAFTFPRKAQQHHHESLSQHFQQYSDRSDERQCHALEPKVPDLKLSAFAVSAKKWLNRS